LPVDLFIVESDPKLRTRLSMQAEEVAPTTPYPGVEALLEELRVGRPAVVVFGPTFADPDGLAQIEKVTRSRPELAAILMVGELSTGLLQQALRAGVKDVLGLPSETQALRESVERVAETLSPVHLPPGAEAKRTERGRVITVTSTKGGAGKSVVATNLAIALARKTEGPVVLVDADLQFGDVAVLLRLSPGHTVVDAVSSIQRLDAQFLQSLLVRHEASGLLILAAPIEPSFAERVSGADMVKIVEVLQSFCSHVVIDTPAQFDDVVLGLIEHSDDVLMVAALDIPSIKNVKLGLQTLRMLSIPEMKLKLVINRANSKVRLDVSEVERTLGLKAACLVPSDILVPQSVNKGTPAILDAPRSAVAKAFEQLADLYSGAPSDVPISKARGRFGLF
jgi:pilus assembly protein CpaE